MRLLTKRFREWLPPTSGLLDFLPALLLRLNLPRRRPGGGRIDSRDKAHRFVLARFWPIGKLFTTRSPRPKGRYRVKARRVEKDSPFLPGRSGAGALRIRSSTLWPICRLATFLIFGHSEGGGTSRKPPRRNVNDRIPQSVKRAAQTETCDCI